MAPSLGSDISSDAGSKLGQGVVGQRIERQDRGAELEPVLRPRIGPRLQAGERGLICGIR